MGSLLHLQDAHERAQMLLPWRANGTLEAAELALFEAHLAECAECRADLAAEAAVRDEWASMPMPDLAETMRATSLPGRSVRPAAVRRWFLARHVSLGSALAGAAVAAALALLVAAPQPRSDTEARYRLLGSDEGRSSGNLIVMFAPDTRERQLRAALAESGGRLVDGPTASGAYIVHIAPAARAAALDRLRNRAEVVLAEPIDPVRTP